MWMCGVEEVLGREGSEREGRDVKWALLLSGHAVGDTRLISSSSVPADGPGGGSNTWGVIVVLPATPLKSCPCPSKQPRRVGTEAPFIK